MAARSGAFLAVALAVAGAVSMCGCESSPYRPGGAPDGARPRDADDAGISVAPGDATSVERDLPTPMADAPDRVVDVPVAIDARPPSADLAPLIFDTPAAVDAPFAADLPPAVVDAPIGQCRTLPGPANVGGPGRQRWVWLYDPGVADLRSLCASHGSKAKLVLEVVGSGFESPRAPLPYCTPDEVSFGGLRACSVADGYRFVADCEMADMLVELPTDKPPFDAYVHLESADVPSSPRLKATIDPQCERHLSGGLTPWPSPAPDGGVPPRDAGTAVGAVDAGACPYLATSRVDETGKTLWLFNFDWRQDDLADICGSYGDGAKMVVELRAKVPYPASDLPACTMFEVMGAGDRSCAFGPRVEADCMQGQLAFEADQDSGLGIGLFHIESRQYPDPPRRYLVYDTACPRLLRPRFMPMVPAGNPDVGTEVGKVFALDYDPSEYGQPCQLNSDCPRSYQECFIDAAVTTCLGDAIGRCVPVASSNCVAYSYGCACLHPVGGSMCGDAPGTACGNLYAPGAPIPVNPQSGTQCHACLPQAPP
jgi:hypothetical protein